MSKKRYNKNSSSQKSEKHMSSRRRFTQIMAITLSILMCVGAFSYLIFAILGLL